MHATVRLSSTVYIISIMSGCALCTAWYHLCVTGPNMSDCPVYYCMVSLNPTCLVVLCVTPWRRLFHRANVSDCAMCHGAQHV